MKSVTLPSKKALSSHSLTRLEGGGSCCPGAVRIVVEGEGRGSDCHSNYFLYSPSVRGLRRGIINHIAIREERQGGTLQRDLEYEDKRVTESTYPAEGVVQVFDPSLHSMYVSPTGHVYRRFLSYDRGKKPKTEAFSRTRKYKTSGRPLKNFNLFLPAGELI